jgi:hypothetical protein
MKGIILAVTVGFSVVALYASTFSTKALATADQNDSTSPAVFPSTGQPTPMNTTNQVSKTGGNPNLPPAYKGGPSNLHDTIGTNAANQGNDQPTLTNHPNPNAQMP